MARITYTKELLEDAVKESFSVFGVLVYLGLRPAGGTHSHVSKKIKAFGIDTSHFYSDRNIPWNKGKVSSRRKTVDEILIVLPPGSPRPKLHQLRRALSELGVKQVCACGVGTEWEGKPLQLEIDHIDGDWLNNLRENLRFICPNCHSQESTTNLPHKYR